MRTLVSQPEAAGAKSPAKGLIFVVDDQELLGELASTLLRLEGYQVEQFTDPKRALQAIEEAALKPVALVTDYEMKEMNGLDLIVEARKICPSLKTVLLSGTVDVSVAFGHPNQVQRFLAKPYQPAQLNSAVEELLR